MRANRIFKKADGKNICGGSPLDGVTHFYSDQKPKKVTIKMPHFMADGSIGVLTKELTGYQCRCEEAILLDISSIYNEFDYKGNGPYIVNDGAFQNALIALMVRGQLIGKEGVKSVSLSGNPKPDTSNHQQAAIGTSPIHQEDYAINNLVNGLDYEHKVLKEEVKSKVTEEHENKLKRLLEAMFDCDIEIEDRFKGFFTLSVLKSLIDE